MDVNDQLFDINILDVEFTEFMASQATLKQEQNNRSVPALQDRTYEYSGLLDIYDLPRLAFSFTLIRPDMTLPEIWNGISIRSILLLRDNRKRR